jgi:hypothetical protein
MYKRTAVVYQNKIEMLICKIYKLHISYSTVRIKRLYKNERNYG